MIPELQRKVQLWVEQIGDPGKTLEIGSYNVNGGVSHFFTDYIGTDMRRGRGVDLAVNSHDLLRHFKENTFDTIVWLETMEHDDAFWVTMDIINTLIKTGGHVMMSAPGITFHHHDYPSDYWRFTEDALRVLLKGWEVLEVTTLKDTIGQPVVCALARYTGLR